MNTDFAVVGTSTKALFTLKIHRGDGMALLAMNWKYGKPPLSFVGFAIEYKEPAGIQFFPLKNRLTFPSQAKSTDPNRFTSLNSPFQKFRWVHFPRNPELPGLFTYRVTPVFMDALGVLSYGDPQQASLALARETYPGKLNVTYTRGFVASQAFVDFYQKDGPISKLIPGEAKNGLTFKPTHPGKDKALPWMGFEAYSAILEVLDDAIKDKTAQVRLIAYDFNQPEILDRLKKLKKRVKVIIDDSKDHKGTGSAETKAEKALIATAGAGNVIRQHQSNLQHNKMIVVNGKKIKRVVCGSTNFSWRGFFVQSNNALILTGSKPVQVFMDAFEDYWNNKSAKTFTKTKSPLWHNLGLTGINAKVAFSPHSDENALLAKVADDIKKKGNTSVLYSLAFLNQTSGAVTEAIKKVTNDPKIFVYGMSDKEAGGILVKSPATTNPAPVFARALTTEILPQPFRREQLGGKGTRIHHKFVVLDFNKPSARVYLGSYNFSNPADLKNGENLVLVKDRRIATSYMIEAVRLFDHYEFRVLQIKKKKAGKRLELKPAPAKKTEKPWWDKDYTEKMRIRDRELFSS